VDDPSESIVVAHVGDSRAYRVRDGELEQLTEDHSLVGELLRSGRLSAEEAELHPQRSVITRAIGTEPDVDVDTFTVPTRPGDLFLLCSDGLTDMIPDREILSILDGSDELDDAARALVDAANSAGGEDNITVVLFRIAQPGEDTVRMPAAAAPAQPEPEPELEDTLSGLEGVPAVDTAVVSAEDVREHIRREEARSGELRSDEARGRRSVLPLLLLVLLLLAVAALVVWGLYR
jgi:PPM family protein phosphatase